MSSLTLVMCATLLLSSVQAQADTDEMTNDGTNDDLQLEPLVVEDLGKDLLNGAGKFDVLDPAQWFSVSPDSYESIAIATGEDGGMYLEMTKPEDSSGFFDDGIVFTFKDEAGALLDVKPMHIHIELQTGSQDVETCDFRLYSVEESTETEDEKTHQTVCNNGDRATGGPSIEEEGANPTNEEGSPDRADGAMRRNLQDETEEAEEGDGDDSGETAEDQDPEDEASDCTSGEVEIEKAPDGFGNYTKVDHSSIALLRMGFFNHIKLNTESMLKEFFEGEWYSIDLLIDWEMQTVSIYADGDALMAVPFFTKRATKLQHFNTISLYGLTPSGVSRFRNLQVCDDICDGVVDSSELSIISGSMLTLGSSMVAALGALLFTLTA